MDCVEDRVSLCSSDVLHERYLPIGTTIALRDQLFERGNHAIQGGRDRFRSDK